MPRIPFPPRARWSRTFGFILIQDPHTGEWLELDKDDAPTGYRQYAQQEKLDYLARRGDARGLQGQPWKR